MKVLLYVLLAWSVAAFVIVLNAPSSFLYGAADRRTAWQNLYEMESRDASVLLYHIRRAHPETAAEMRPFFEKWQGLPADPEQKLAELRKRSK